MNITKQRFLSTGAFPTTNGFESLHDWGMKKKEANPDKGYTIWLLALIIIHYILGCFARNAPPYFWERYSTDRVTLIAHYSHCTRSEKYGDHNSLCRRTNSPLDCRISCTRLWASRHSPRIRRPRRSSWTKLLLIIGTAVRWLGGYKLRRGRGVVIEGPGTFLSNEFWIADKVRTSGRSQLDSPMAWCGECVGCFVSSSNSLNQSTCTTG